MSVISLVLTVIAVGLLAGLLLLLLIRGSYLLRDTRSLEPEPAAPSERPVKFNTLWPRYIQAEEWKSLIVYMYSGRDGLEGARTDFEKRLTRPLEEYGKGEATAELQGGTEITILPELTGFIFNPPVATIFWLEQWHCIEFRMRARHSPPGPARGRVAFFVGPLLVAETELAIEIMDHASGTETSLPDDLYYVDWFSGAESSTYRAIFVSYSHEDSVIVRQLERAYRAIGDSYLRDVAILRSGEKWSTALLSMISRADVFQLCWSQAARKSTHVEQEWRHAFGLRRRNFIRPIYWEEPMPEPPPELRDIHFSFMEIAAA